MNFLSTVDTNILSPILADDINTFSYFYDVNLHKDVKVIISVYNNYDNELINILKYPFSEFNIPEFISVSANSNSVEIFTENILKYIGYMVGSYTVKYRFYVDILGSDDNKLFIKKISPTRKEILVDYMQDSIASEYTSFCKELNSHFNTYNRKFLFDKFLMFDNEIFDIAPILNCKNQTTGSENSLILKMYGALNSKHKIKSFAHIVKFVCDELSDTVYIDFSEKPDSLYGVNILKSAKIDPEYYNISQTPTLYKTYDQLIDTSSLGKDVFSNMLYNNDSMELNIKYRQFEEFINFGSATHMLYNFRNKLITLERLNPNIISGSTNNIASSSILYENAKYDIIGNFTPYERFLYFESGSYISCSKYEKQYSELDIIDSTYPKSGSSDFTKWQLYSISSSVSQNWFATMSACAAKYDEYNSNNLTRTIPSYIVNDADSNTDYINFINMIGEFYDNIWIYAKSMNRIFKRDNISEDSAPSDIIWNLLKNQGFNFNNGFDNIDINRYRYKYDINNVDMTQMERSEKNVIHEIWNRILNNYMYIIKSKGTVKGLRALFNCYGIPRTYVKIQEFGGPNISDDSDNMKKYMFDYEDFTFVLNMEGNQTIYLPWVNTQIDSMKPDSIEFKIRIDSEPNIVKHMDILCITGSAGEIKLAVSQSHADVGRFVMSFITPSQQIHVSSSVKSFFNEEFYSVLLKRSVETDNPSDTQTYYLKIQNHDDYINKIILDETLVLNVTESSINNIYANSSHFYLGGHVSSSNKFSGQIDEFRLWSEPLSDSAYTYHTKYSAAINGNNITSSINSLVFRLSFNDVYDVFLSPTMSNDAFNTTLYTASYATMIGFESKSEFPYNFSSFIRSNTVEHSYIGSDNVNNKIRIESNSIINYIDTGSIRVYPLKNSKFHISDGMVGEVGEFDGHNIDYDLLIVGFTPIDIQNNDIIAFYGNTNILQQYGSFYDRYESYYPKNDFLINTYWKNNNVIKYDEYLKYIRKYDNSLFDIVHELVPAKASTAVGTVYDQNILRRSKIKLISKEKAQTYNQNMSILNLDTYIIKNTISDLSIINDAILKNVVKISDALNIEDMCFSTIIKNDIGSIIDGVDEVRCGEISCKLSIIDDTNYVENNINRQRRIKNINIFTKSNKNGSNTTYDRKPAVEIKVSSPNRLTANYSDTKKLTVT